MNSKSTELVYTSMPFVLDFHSILNNVLGRNPFVRLIWLNIAFNNHIMTVSGCGRKLTAHF